MFKEKPQLPESSQYVIDLKEMYALRRQAEQRGDSLEATQLTNTINVMEIVLHQLVSKQVKK